MLNIEIRLPVLLYAVKTVEGDFRFTERPLQMQGNFTKKIPREL